MKNDKIFCPSYDPTKYKKIKQPPLPKHLLRMLNNFKHAPTKEEIIETVRMANEITFHTYFTKINQGMSPKAVYKLLMDDDKGQMEAAEGEAAEGEAAEGEAAEGEAAEGEAVRIVKVNCNGWAKFDAVYAAGLAINSMFHAEEMAEKITYEAAKQIVDSIKCECVDPDCPLPDSLTLIGEMTTVAMLQLQVYDPHPEWGQEGDDIENYRYWHLIIGRRDWSKGCFCRKS